MISSERFTVVYRVTVNDERTIEAHAKDIAIEQTVEIPESCIPLQHYSEGIVGSVEEIALIAGTTNVYEVSISYRNDVTAYSIPQLFNTLFGNISIKNNIRIVKLRFPESLCRMFKGPDFGIDGLRKMTGVYGRPLAFTALKPMGITASELALMAEKFALAGIDLIKDDHGITDQHFHPFKERVDRVTEAVQRANILTGGSTMYFPAVCTTFDKIESHVEYAVSKGIKGILIAPMLVGIDTVRYLADKYNLIIAGHPAFAGTLTYNAVHGMTPAVLYGTLFRLLGADISIFPNWGGRFPFSKEECLEIADALREPYHNWKPSFPAPAGGMNLKRLGEIAHSFGPDTALLIGGALIQEGIDKATKEFMAELRRLFPESKG